MSRPSTPVPAKASVVVGTITASVLAVSAASDSVTIDWSTVGNAGNTANADVTSRSVGSVGYVYRIGTYEVTNAQYAAFLNAVASGDPNGLYSTSMGSNTRGGITRSGSDGSYTYAVKPNMGDKPVNFVSWYDAARMANWMTNGQGSGSTESGVYTLTGPTSIGAITRDLLNVSQVFIPTDNEWHKAAYHQPAAEGGDTDDYWLYATQSNAVPTVATTTDTGDVANPGTGVVNYSRGAHWNGTDGNVTTVGSAGNASFYGAFDMNGNVREWNERLTGSVLADFGGGSWFDEERKLQSVLRSGVSRSTESSQYGFRFASPACVVCSDTERGTTDGAVNTTDLLALLGAFGMGDGSTPGFDPADLNCDGFVDTADLLQLLSEFGGTVNC